MPRKTQSPSDDALESRDVRRRVVKACQRCRLKKCKCDGANPCTRCKSDDAICAYGKHKKTDKIVFRKGYVQMLERQHAQLIAGLQELYQRTQNGQGWTSPPLELTNYGQPLTHKILEGLGVLRSDEWDDGETQDGMPSWHSFEQQSQEGSGMVDDDASTTTSPASTAVMSPISTTQIPFPNSTIMAKRRSKYGAPVASTTQTLDMGSMAASQSFRPFPYNTKPNFPQGDYYNQDWSVQIPPSGSMFNNNPDEGHQYSDGSDNYPGNDNLALGALDWISVPDDMLNHSTQHGLPLLVQ